MSQRKVTPNPSIERTHRQAASGPHFILGLTRPASTRGSTQTLGVATPGAHLRTNYVLIDYENVQPEVLPGLDADHFKVLLFVGANQAKLSFDIVSAMQRLGTRAEYIKIAGNGSNALDFHIAFYIGHLAAQDQTGYFHIISKDTGFDPLIQHLSRRRDRKSVV